MTILIIKYRVNRPVIKTAKTVILEIINMGTGTPVSAGSLVTLVKHFLITIQWQGNEKLSNLVTRI